MSRLSCPPSPPPSVCVAVGASARAAQRCGNATRWLPPDSQTPRGGPPPHPEETPRRHSRSFDGARSTTSAGSRPTESGVEVVGFVTSPHTPNYPPPPSPPGQWAPPPPPPGGALALTSGQPDVVPSSGGPSSSSGAQAQPATTTESPAVDEDVMQAMTNQLTTASSDNHDDEEDNTT